jgi:hypothetical protein
MICYLRQNVEKRGRQYHRASQEPSCFGQIWVTQTDRYD